MTDLFQFEADFANTLHCIPMQVRLKLDTCGIKLKLNQWSLLSESDKKQLLTTNCNSPEETASYRRLLKELIQEKTGQEATELLIDKAPAWLNQTEIPQRILDKAAEEKLSFSKEMWSNLTPLQRFALLKLSASGHENRNFLPAFKEFGLQKALDY